MDKLFFLFSFKFSRHTGAAKTHITHICFSCESVKRQNQLFLYPSPHIWMTSVKDYVHSVTAFSGSSMMVFSVIAAAYCLVALAWRVPRDDQIAL